MIKWRPVESVTVLVLSVSLAVSSHEEHQLDGDVRCEVGQKTFLTRDLSSGLLRNDAVARGGQAHVVHLDEGLAIKAQAVDQGLEMTWQHV